MILQLIHPSYTKELSISWIELNTDIGNFVIQPGHAPMILMLENNKKMVYCLHTGKQESLSIDRGVVHITRTQTTIIFN